MRISSDLTDEQVETLTNEELAAWSEAQALGAWEPNDAPAEWPPTGPLAVRLPAELLAELRAEAAAHRQSSEQYARDLLLLALRLVQAGRNRRAWPGFTVRADRGGCAASDR